MRGVVPALGLALVAIASPSFALAAPCAATRILMMSDSHGLTGFGDVMDAWLSSQPEAELESFTLGGSNPEWWFRGTATPRGYVYRSCDGGAPHPRARLVHRPVRAPLLAQLLASGGDAYERQVVIIAMGSNVPGRPGVYTEWGERMIRVIRARPETLCIWVGPPKMRKVSLAYSDRVYAAIRDGIDAAGVGPDGSPACHLIDSRPWSDYPRGGDGVHYPFSPAGVAAVERWTAGVIGAIDGIFATTVADRVALRRRDRISAEL